MFSMKTDFHLLWIYASEISQTDVRNEAVSTKEFTLQQRYSTLQGVLKLKCPFAVTQWRLLCLEKDVTPFIVIV